MTSQVTSAIGVPSELNWTLPSSMLPSRKFETRIQPFGQSTFNQSGQSLRLVLPQLQRSVYNFQTGYLFGTISFTQTGGVVNTDNSFLLGSWYSLFSRQVVRAGSGYVLETIDNPGQLVNAISSMTMSPAEKLTLNNSFGFNPELPYSNVGVQMNITPIVGPANSNELNFSFAIPLIGILNNTKMVPSWVGDLEIELTLASLTSYIASASQANTITAFNLSNVEYVVETIELSPESYNMLLSQNPEKVILKTQTYSYGSSALAPGQGQGTIDIPFQIKVNSLKQLIWYSSPTGTVPSIDKNYGGVNPNLNSWQFICNSTSYPMQPVKARFPAEAFLQNQKSFGSVYSTNHSGCQTRKHFNVAYSTYNNYHRKYSDEYAEIADGNKWFQCLDLEVINQDKQNLYSGVTTNGTSATIRLNIDTALPAGVGANIHYWSCQDVMIVMDMVSGITSVVV